MPGTARAIGRALVLLAAVTCSCGHETDAVVPQEVERVIQGVAEQMGGEIQRSLDFFASSAVLPRINSVARLATAIAVSQPKD